MKCILKDICKVNSVSFLPFFHSSLMPVNLIRSERHLTHSATKQNYALGYKILTNLRWVHMWITFTFLWNTKSRISKLFREFLLVLLNYCQISSKREGIFFKCSIRAIHNTHITYKHKCGGHVVYLHTMEFIQPHFFWLDLTVERRELLCHTSKIQKIIVRFINWF